MGRVGSCGYEELADEGDLAIDARSFVMEMAALDRFVQKGLRSLCIPPIKGRGINGGPALSEQIYHVQVGQRKTHMPANSTQDDVSRKAMMFKR